MPAYVNFVCDKGVQSIIFESTTETWGDALRGMMNLGWALELDGAIVKRCVCPECSLKCPRGGQDGA
jgi:hypothetical protein